MSDPVSLRNIPPDALKLAHALSVQTGLSLGAVFRLALTSGLLIEATKVAPGLDETLGGLETASLAKALRRHLSSAIDLLVEYGEHPYQGMMGQGERPQQGTPRTLPRLEEPADPKLVEEQSLLFENAIADDLDLLGIGMSLAEIVESQGISPKTSE
ncbi:MAG TPA: hypothetical protein VFV38_41275 [Ktedonobacteraceae bacterium]|nr:hypothetical protein [Ktedonobacteraceae bacterium]